MPVISLNSASFTIAVVGFLGLFLTSACSQGGALGSGKKLDATNTDTFLASFNEIISDMPEEQRETFIENIYLIHTEGGDSDIVRKSELYPSDRSILLDAKEIVLNSGGSLNGSNEKELAQIAHQIRRDRLLTSINNIQADAEEQILYAAEGQVCDRNRLEYLKTTNNYPWGRYPAQRAHAIAETQQSEANCGYRKAEAEAFLATLEKRREVAKAWQSDEELDEALIAKFSSDFRCSWSNFCPEDINRARQERGVR